MATRMIRQENRLYADPQFDVGSAREIVLTSARDLRRGLVLVTSYTLHDAGGLAYVYAPTAISEKSPTLKGQLLNVATGCS